MTPSPMLRKILFSIVMFISIQFGFSQNLVLNGSFERYNTCPTGPFEIDKSIFWFSANDGRGGSSDYFNSCSNPSNVGVPNNLFGVQYPRSGNAYSGCSFFETDGEYREYIEGSLIEPLKSSNNYCVSFWVSLAEISQCGIDALQIYFTNDSFITYSSYVAIVPAQISNTEFNVITDTAEWIKISGNFTSFGGERFFTIGNFRRNSQTHFIVIGQLPIPVAYYYIDDVVVYPCNTPIYIANGGGDKTICTGESITLGSRQDENYEYRWYGENGALIDTTGFLTVNPTTTTTYYLWVKDFKYDVTTDTVTVVVEEPCSKYHTVFIPNIFSPDGDGNNDFLIVQGEYIKRLTFAVYNRWGNEVFRSSELNTGWDGRYKNKDCSAGVYFYVAEVTFADGTSTVKKGNVTLVR